MGGTGARKVEDDEKGVFRVVSPDDPEEGVMTPTRTLFMVHLLNAGMLPLINHLCNITINLLSNG